MSHTRPARPRRIKHTEYDFNVFINCPFDEEYTPLFRAIIFSIHACGFIARCSREISNQNIRFSRIIEIIGECKYGVHDLSRINLEEGVLPRNNMPLELGVFIGCRHFGSSYDYEKEYLVLDSIPHRYKHHITDLGGEDPSIHHNKVEEIVRCMRDWLVQRAPPSERSLIQSPSILAERLADFNEEAPSKCAKRGWRFNELLFYEYVELVTDWLADERKRMTEYDQFEEKITHNVSIGKVELSSSDKS